MADPGWRQPSPRTSNCGWSFLVFFAVYEADPAYARISPGAVVHDPGGRVADVVASQALDPRPLAARDAAGLEHGIGVLPVGDDRRRVQPLLGDPLHPVVEGGDDRVAAGVNGARTRFHRTGSWSQLVAHLPREVGGVPRIGRPGGQDYRFHLGRVEVGRGILALREPRLDPHRIEDQVAAPHDRSGLRHHEPDLFLAITVLVRLLDWRCGRDRTAWATSGCPQAGRTGRA